VKTVKFHRNSVHNDFTIILTLFFVLNGTNYLILTNLYCQKYSKLFICYEDDKFYNVKLKHLAGNIRECIQ
jgi:hypothetical protein